MSVLRNESARLDSVRAASSVPGAPVGVQSVEYKRAAQQVKETFGRAISGFAWTDSEEINRSREVKEDAYWAMQAVVTSLLGGESQQSDVHAVLSPEFSQHVECEIDYIEKYLAHEDPVNEGFFLKGDTRRAYEDVLSGLRRMVRNA